MSDDQPDPPAGPLDPWGRPMPARPGVAWPTSGPPPAGPPSPPDVVGEPQVAPPPAAGPDGPDVVPPAGPPAGPPQGWAPGPADWWGAPPRGHGGAAVPPVVTGTAQPYLGPAKRDGGSTGALVLGILSLLCAGIFGMAFGVGAIVTGLLSRRRIRASGGMLSGEGTATTGLVLGILGLIVSTIAFVYLTFVNPDALSELLDQLETTTTTTTPR